METGSSMLRLFRISWWSSPYGDGCNPQGLDPAWKLRERIRYWRVPGCSGKAGILTMIPWNDSILILPLRPDGDDEKEAHTRLFNKRKKWFYKENFQLKCCFYQPKNKSREFKSKGYMHIPSPFGAANVVGYPQTMV